MSNETRTKEIFKSLRYRIIDSAWKFPLEGESLKAFQKVIRMEALYFGSIAKDRKRRRP